jgi:hypothetical protein
MFTDPPLLIERIARRIDDTKISDGMSGISIDSPSARTLGELTDHPAVIRELRSVGAPESILSASAGDNSVAVVRERLPYLGKIRNTGTFWRLMRILNDLYDYTTPEVLDSELEALDDRIRAQAASPDWARQILDERCRIAHLNCDIAKASDPASAAVKLGVPVHYFCNATALLSVRHPSKNADRHVTEPAYTKVLESTIGLRPTSYATLKSGIGDFLDRTVSGQTRYLTARISTRIRSESNDGSAIDSLLARESGGVPLTDDETDMIASAVGSTIFTWAHENQRSIVIQGIGRSPHQQAFGCPATIARLAKTFSGAKLVLADYSRDFARHAHYLAASSPNVAIAGFADSTCVTSAIAAESFERLQFVPIGKAIGFMSLAPTVEWLYGNLQAVRYGIARSIAQAIEIDHFHENRIRDLLTDTLETSAVEFLGL